ncbi:hypothetical protein GCM10027020_20460 [Nocardioides salsibiostraticola]
MSDKQAAPIPALIHLTSELSVFVAILRDGRLRATTAYGAIRNLPGLSESQRVVCLSEVGLEAVGELSRRHGKFGLGFDRRWAQSRGAAPVWYLPRGSSFQTQIFEQIKKLAFDNRPDLNEFLWKLTPFIDYPQDPINETDPSRYDWRWEKEWRVLGDLVFRPQDSLFMLAPQDLHDGVRETWLNACGLGEGHVPPVVDVAWPVERQREILSRGPTFELTSMKQKHDEADGVMEAWEESQRETMDTARQPLTWVENDELLLTESQQEWSTWFDSLGDGDGH